MSGSNSPGIGTCIAVWFVISLIFGLQGNAVADPAPPAGVKRYEVGKQHVALGINIFEQGKYRVWVYDGKGWRQYVTDFMEGGKRYRTVFPRMFNYTGLPGVMNYNVNSDPSLGRSFGDKEFTLDIDNSEILVDRVVFAFQRIKGSGGSTAPTPTPATLKSPPEGLKQFQVKPKVFTAGEFLQPGIYTIWVRIGEYVPAPDAGTQTPTVYRGGVWTPYTNIKCPGGKPRHVTYFPDSIHNNTVNYTDFSNPRYQTPGPKEFVLHIDNRSLTQTVTYVFQRTSAITEDTKHDSNSQLGMKWIECENGRNATWTRQGSSNVFRAVWLATSVKPKVTAILTINITGSVVFIQRRQSSNGDDFDYFGTISTNGNTATGKCRNKNSQETWTATIQH